MFGRSSRVRIPLQEMAMDVLISRVTGRDIYRARLSAQHQRPCERMARLAQPVRASALPARADAQTAVRRVPAEQSMRRLKSNIHPMQLLYGSAPKIPHTE